MSAEPRENRPAEMPAMKTTIVGGRPLGAGMIGGTGSYGIEILLKKAAVDAEFKALLLGKRAAAATEIEGLVLDPAEVAMLNSVPARQLEAIIAGTKVPEDTRRHLLGKVTVAALVAVGLVAFLTPSLGIRPDRLLSKGIEPDRPPGGTDTQPSTGSAETQPDGDAQTQPAAPSLTPRGIRPDKPVSRGIQPDKPGRD